MKISVIIPTLDEEKAIADCLAQFDSDAEVEVLVSDGGSRDRTLQIVAEHTAVKTISTRRGRGPQLNEGARQSGGDVLLFLHCDCQLPLTWKQAILSAMSDPGVVGGYFHLRTSAPDSGPFYNLVLRAADLRSRFLNHPYGDSGIFVRREVFERLGGYLDIPIMEDYEFSKRLVGEGRIIRLPDEIRTSARRFRAGMLKATLLMRLFPLLYRLGVPPDWLDRLYGAER
ncbi:MAG: TIGR04283 family arsenosugar biosynthesis glycosyltransferase [Deltaproteobacteria bacterium]|nr:TIGR04283 family arsenosugar biosynthesis glycosyltransferase [Deltaproteobacteria bacterium]